MAVATSIDALAVGITFAMIPDTSEYNSVEKTTMEPFVFVNCYLKGRCEDMIVGSSWQTGSSAWGLRGFYEGILGLRRDYDGLRIVPTLPTGWNELDAKRVFRGNDLRIFYHNNGGNNVRIEVDGVAIEGNLIRPFADNDTHRIDVYID